MSRKRWLFLSPSIVGVISIVFALFNQTPFGLIFFLAQLICLLVLIAASLFFLFKQKWKDFGLCILGAVMGFICFGVFLYFAEHLLYIT